MTGSRTAQPEENAGRPGIATSVTLHAIVASAALGALYEVYDLSLPNHFVGDMYGLEFLMRGALLAAVGVPFLIASVLGLLNVQGDKLDACLIHEQVEVAQPLGTVTGLDDGGYLHEGRR